MSDTDQEHLEQAPEADQTEPDQQNDNPEPETGTEDELPDWVREKIRKVNNEAKNLRQRLKEQEPLVAAAQEAERAKMSELERAQADLKALQDKLAQRDTELLVERYQIPDEFIEFIGDGSFEEKEARAAKIGKMVTANEPQDRPPSDRPVESLKPGASPSPPPVEDHSYPAAWAPQPNRG